MIAEKKDGYGKNKNHVKIQQSGFPAAHNWPDRRHEDGAVNPFM